MPGPHPRDAQCAATGLIGCYWAAIVYQLRYPCRRTYDPHDVLREMLRTVARELLREMRQIAREQVERQRRLEA